MEQLIAIFCIVVFCVGLLIFSGLNKIAANIKEISKPAYNSRYVAALGVYEEFLRSAEYINGDGFRPWLKACLNPPKAADCT